MEPITVPVVALPAVLFAWRAFRTRSWLDAALGGAFTGLGLYTYPAGRAIPIVVGAIIVYHILAGGRAGWRSAAMSGGLIVIIALAVFLPLGLFWWENPTWLALRMQQVTERTLSESNVSPAAHILDGVWKTLLGLFWRGDMNWRQNLPGRPTFDGLQFIFFAIGLGVCLGRWRRGPYWLLALWTGVGLLPTALTEFPPQFGRAIGATPPLAMIAALGMWMAAKWIGGLAARPGGIQAASAVSAVVVGLSAAFSTGAAFRDYFAVWARAPELFSAFDVGLRAIGQYVARLPANEPVYLTPVPSDWYTLTYFVGDDPNRRRSLNGRVCQVFPAQTTAPAHIITIIHPGEDPRAVVRLSKVYPAGQVVWQFANRSNPYAVDFRIPAQDRAQVEAMKKFHASFAGQIELVGFGLVSRTIRPGEALKAALVWRGLTPMRNSYTMFVHLVGPQYRAHGPELGGFGTLGLWAQDDSAPCRNSFPTNRWYAGDMVWNKHRLTLPISAPAGSYALRAGIYDSATGERLRVLTADGSQYDNSVLLTRITVKGP